jgi:hypothetical protein
MMRLNRALPLLLLCLVLLSLAGTAAAAPAPPLTAVNEETKECGMMPGGDECANCYPTNGWTLLGNGVDVECPTGYVSGEPEYACEHFKARHCCTESHSGSAGDCEDLIISHRYDQCAFVDDIDGCKPPREWTQRPNGRKAEVWLCPADYEWIDDLACAGEEAAASATPEASAGTSLPCLGTLLVAPAVIVLWLVIKRNS